MHISILLGFILLSGSFAFSQTLEFRYDEAGNQIERRLKIEQSQGSPRVVNRSLSIPLIVSETSVSDDFIVYPNPTRGKVTLSWKAEYVGRITEIQLANFLGHAQRVPFDAKAHSVALNLTGKKEGVYIVNIYLDDGRRIDKKILRQN